MSRLAFTWVLFAAAVGAPTRWAVAAAPAESRPAAKLFVLIVANNHSVDPAIADLRYADDDGVQYLRHLEPFAAAAELLTTPDDETQRLFPDDAVRARPPTVKELGQALARLYAQIRAAQSAGGGAVQADLLVIFAGHGGVDGEGRGFLHLADGMLTRADLFREILAASPADFTHVIIDACNAYSLVAGRGGDAAEEQRYQAALADFLADDDLRDYPSVGVLAAVSEDRETHEWSRLRAGVFSHEVRSALTGGADVNHDGRIEYSEVAAFVEAAGAGVREAGRHVSVFAWPPARDRHRAVLDVRAGQGVRPLALAAPLAGRLHLETEAGERWVELNKERDELVLLTIPSSLAFYLRSDTKERVIEPGEDLLLIDESPAEPYAVAGRGAVAQALEQGLFATPFSASYYRGFITGRAQLIPVAAAVSPYLDALRPSPPALVALTAGYQGGLFALASERFEHGLYARAAWPLSDLLALTLQLETGYTAVHGSRTDSAVRLALTPGLEVRRALAARIAVHAGFDLGYGLFSLHGDVGGTDPTVAVGRGRAGLRLHAVGALSVVIEAAYAGYMVTLDGGERFRGRPELMAGVAVGALD